jgi:hypothetical protein
MKIHLYTLAAAALLAGCGKPTTALAPVRWEYKTVEMENYEHFRESVFYYEIETNAEVGLEHTAASLRSDGSFLFSLSGKYGVDFNSLGSEGWELVSAIPQIETTHPISHDEVIAAVRTGKIILIFKRPLP